MYYQVYRGVSWSLREGNSFRISRNSLLIRLSSRLVHNSSACRASSNTKFVNIMETGLAHNVPLTKLATSTVTVDVGKLTRFDNITKSQQDNRNYRGLQLENGLKVLLISDPSTDKSAAALSVEVGHLSDPDEIPGLAHFCEHMLFLGTKKYTNENDYMAFLSNNGGSSNAATYADTTKYYFDVVPEKLQEALDRFSQFFISPLFTESATEREINAVHSEHEKNLSMDVWRIRQVNKSLCDPKHPYNKFGTGSKKTLLEDPKLSNINIREELMKFHSKWYSANIMSLAVFGKESLDELESMVVQMFSDIENKNVTSPRWKELPFGKDQLATKTMVVPVKDSRSLTITFQTEDLERFYKAGPEHYVSHLIGHEGVGSILSELKAKGWCNNLVGGYSTIGRGFGFFEVMVDLTQDGFEHIDDIVKIIFQYINMLKKEGPQKWIFEEYCNLCEMQFRFKDKENPLSLVSNVVHSMQSYPLEEVLAAPYLISEWKPELIVDLWNKFYPQNARITIVGQKCEENAKQEEEWYGTKYTSEKLSESVMESWSKPDLNENLHLPERNPFIPTNFDLVPVDADIQSIPVIIHNTPIIRVWFKQDVEFLKPKTLMNLDFCSPIVYSDPLNCNLTHMFVQLFKDHLNEYMYAADLAGLRLMVANTTYGISVSIGGYNHKQHILLDKVLNDLYSFKIDEKRFEILKEQYVRNLKNYNAEQPYQHAVYYLALLLSEQAWSKQELIDATELLTVDKLRSFIDELLSRMHVECFIHGNINKEKALEISKKVEDKLKNTDASVLPLLSRQLMLKREYKLNTDEHCLFETNNDYHKSSCAELYLQCGMQDDQSNVYVDLVTQILSEPCYNQLRTKEQLGYIVFCGARKSNGVQGIRVIVQSAKHPALVEERIENFLNGMIDHLETMSEEEFKRHKEALAAQKLEKPKRLATQFTKFLNEICLQQYHFNRAQVEVAFLQTLTKQQIIEYYKEFIIMGAPSRRSLSIHVVSTAEGGAGHKDAPAEETERSTNDTATAKDYVKVCDLAGFKSTRALYPMVQPYIDIKPKGSKCKL
ncbi:insulin-degrading enzyme [Topomyia yanbarensis]|uniref:insulin-degrading enzyme n=1 Tax=Topomyia yanbarensis TaxID=2498891 RepID=UPI00273B7624|nr:insulin-degrading enzyme [Topomyia yanbarensis]